MTDRERLLQQVRDAEKRAGRHWTIFKREFHPLTTVEIIAGNAAAEAKGAAHHALTAMALRDLLPFAFGAEGSEYEET